MAECININSPEFKSLADKVDIPINLLASKVLSFQEANDTYDLPTPDYFIKDTFEAKNEAVGNMLMLGDLNQFEAIRNDLEKSGVEELLNKYRNVKREIPTPDQFKAKTEKLQKILDAKVILNDKLESAGSLLASDHPLSKKYGKPVILINPYKAYGDTLEHEFSHIIVELISNQPIFNDLVEFVNTTSELDSVKERYPELSELDQIKEAAASLLGSSLAYKLNKDLKSISAFRKLMDRILEALGKLFNGQNTIDKVRDAFLDNTLKMDSIELFNNTIERQQKFVYEVDKNNPQDSVVKFLDAMNKNLTLDLDTHIYYDKQGSSYTTSITRLLKKGKRSGFANRRGDFNVPFFDDYLRATNLEETLASNTKIPKAFDDALITFFSGGIAGTTKETKNIDKSHETRKYWGDVYSELALKGEDRQVMLKDIEDNIDAISEIASTYNVNNNKASIAGTYLHSLVEDFIDGKINSFPPNVEDGEKIVEALSKIKSEALARGSVLRTELSVLSSNNKYPGQIDIIEITKDGKARIYDLKTVSPKKYDSDKQTHAREYIPQQYAYSTLLEQYGIEPVEENPYNVLLVDINRDTFNEETKQAKVNRVELINFDRSMHYVNNIIKANEHNINQALGNDMLLKEYNLKSLEQRAKELSSELANTVKVFNKLTGISSRTAKFKDNDVYAAQFRELEKNIEKIKELEAKNGTLIMVNKFIDAFIRSAADIESSELLDMGEYASESFLANLRNFEHLGGKLEGLQVIISEIRATDPSFDIAIDVNTLASKLSQATEMYNKFKFNYNLKRKDHVIRVLSGATRMSIAQQKSLFESEARSKGITAREDIENYVIEKMDNADLINALKLKEYDTWERLLDNMPDLSVFDKWFADPAINKNIAVQAVNAILNKVDQGVRRYIDNYIPDLQKKEKSFGLKGNTSKEKYSKFIVNDFTTYFEESVMPNKELDKDVIEYFKTHNSRFLIPKNISIAYKAELTLKLHEIYYGNQLELLRRNTNEADKAKDEYIKKVEELNVKIEELAKNKDKYYKRIKETKGKSKLNQSLAQIYFKHKPNPDYERLSAKEKEALDYYTEQIRDQESYLNGDVANYLRLVSYSSASDVLNENLPTDSKDRYTQLPMVFLPNMNRSYWETNIDPKQTILDKIEDAKQLWRPSGDESDYNYLSESETDLIDKSLGSVPLFYRRALSDPKLQSYDIPTMIALNMETVQSYHAYRQAEPDMYLITDAISETKIKKKDSIMSKDILSKTTGNKVITNENAIVTTLENVMKARIYSLRYANVNSKSSYRAAKMLEKLKSTTSDIFLVLNYNSAITTSFQGTMYRMIEGIGAEYMTKTDVKKGSQKAWGDYGSMLKDVLYNNFPESKSVLMMRRFGLEAQFQALSKKFVEDSAFKRTMTKDQLYAFTAMGEYLVTSSLMYSVMNNIKAMNADKKYIDKHGNVTTKEKAMTLDEAYSVEDGKLVVNKHLVYTSNNITAQYNTKREKDNTKEALMVGMKISGLYKNLYGQYDNRLKSNLEMTILGESLMHLRKWAVRGTHNRFRGMTSTLGMSFEERRDPENIDKLFYSLELDGFKEGYFTTTMSYIYNLVKETSKLGSFSAAKSLISSQMNTHEKANLKRGISEAIITLMLTAAVMLLARMAYAGDDKDKEDKYIWFLTYTLVRIRDEAKFYFDPNQITEMAATPIIGMSVLEKMGKLLKQALWFDYDYKTGEIDWLFNDYYETGQYRGESKVFRQLMGLTPGVTKTEKLLNLADITEDTNSNSMKSSAEFMINAR